jgi:hypothetical protein
MPKYWQLASGDVSRELQHVMLDFGTACVGPGRLGPLSADTAPHYKELGDGSYEKIKPIQDIKLGDRIVLKIGRSRIIAVGEVTGPYAHASCFHDIDGWDMEHHVPVAWRDLQLIYPNNPLTRATLQRLNQANIIHDIEAVWDAAPLVPARHSVIKSEEDLPDHRIEQALINHGLRLEDAENTTRTLARIRKLVSWYGRIKYSASEEEIKAFLVVPFLQALGWPPQRIGLEVNHRDLVLYADSNRQHPLVLIETKRMHEGSAKAMQQVKNYAKHNPPGQLRHLLVSDGLRYWLLEPTSEGNWRKAAYMNLTRLRANCPAYPLLKGALGLITSLIPPSPLHVTN